MIVAGWFAALFGLGSLVVLSERLEHAMAAIGIAELSAAASPPLRPAAIGVVSLMAAVAGGLAGFAIARCVTRAYRRPRLRSGAGFAPRPPRPLSVRDDLGSEFFGNGPQPQGDVQWANAFAEDDEPDEPRPASADPPPDERTPPLRGAGPRSAPGNELSAQPDLAQLVERLGASLERRRARAAYPRQTRMRTRTSPPAMPTDCAPSRAETDAALRAALARLQKVDAGW